MRAIYIFVFLFMIFFIDFQAEAATCADPGMPSNCVEVVPGQSGDGYEYHADHKVYFFRNLSNQDHYFLLMGDISCDKTCTVFGFEDGNPDVDAKTTLDLNGYTMEYSAANYESIPNNGFEVWSGGSPADWSLLSGSVEQRDTAYWHPMSGESVLYAPGSVELRSSLISLPAARAYQGYVTMGRTSGSSNYTVEVLNEAGQVMCSTTETGSVRGKSIACRFDASGPGNYRLRINGQSGGYYDRTGIVPIGDFGVAVLTGWSISDSNAYQKPIVQNLPDLSIPASGDHASPDRRNLLEVKNGSIISKNENQLSYGIYTSGTTSGHFHHLNIEGKGLKSHTISAGAEIHDNNLVVNMPWYFARESSEEENVILRGGSFYRNNAIGGQGVIRLGGTGTKVHDNYIRNNAQATNHYAIIQSGAKDAEIYNNIFDPIEGSGILTYTGQGYRIYGNVFHMKPATCNVEYINEDYTTNGIRLNDYGSGENRNNWIYDNTFYIEGHGFDTAWPNCMNVTTGIFYSAWGENNRIFNNHFEVIKKDDSEKAPVFAIYIGHASNNPEDHLLFHHNVIEANDQAIWISSFYGESHNMWFEDNYFVKLPNEYFTSPRPNAAIRMGYRSSAVANNVRLVNNRFLGGFDSDDYYFTASGSSATYDLEKRWYVHYRVVGANGEPAVGAIVESQSSGDETLTGTTDENGYALLRVLEYKEAGDMQPNGVHDRSSHNSHLMTVTYNGQELNLGNVSVTGETEITVDFGDESSDVTDVADDTPPDVGADDPIGPGFDPPDGLGDGDDSSTGSSSNAARVSGGGCSMSTDGFRWEMLFLLLLLGCSSIRIRSEDF